MHNSNLLLSILYYLLPYLVWKTVPPPDGIRYICKIRVRFTTEFFPRTRIYRIDADGSLMGW